jgi:hypothetical protein
MVVRDGDMHNMMSILGAGGGGTLLAAFFAGAVGAFGFAWSGAGGGGPDEVVERCQVSNKKDKLTTKSGQKHILFWSAGCSSGGEVPSGEPGHLASTGGA